MTYMISLRELTERTALAPSAQLPRAGLLLELCGWALCLLSCWHVLQVVCLSVRPVGGWWQLERPAFSLLSYILWWGFGDLLVLVFFGLVPVVATFYLQTSFVCLPLVISAVACGLVIDTLLVLNNYRDREADAISGKHTVVVLFGELFGKWLYLLLGFVACALASSLFVFGRYAAAFMPLLYLLPHLQTWRMMVRINKGRELNSVLGQTSRNIAFFGILFAIGWLLG